MNCLTYEHFLRTCFEACLEFNSIHFIIFIDLSINTQDPYHYGNDFQFFGYLSLGMDSGLYPITCKILKKRI